MPLPAEIKRSMDIIFAAYCARRSPEHLKNKLIISHKIRGNSVTIYERRPRFSKPDEWYEMIVAKFRFDSKTETWTLYYPDKNSRLHKYTEIEPTADIAVLLEEVDEDPTRIFWG
ncbi:DUF3024 domain-containing protein [bacterium]|nr:DUF3024 domain-containing protein [bacterium]